MRRDRTDFEKVKWSFWSQIDRRGRDECWDWQGAKNNAGYGCFHLNGKFWMAHRFMYRIKTGEEIPSGLVVRHKCNRPVCCNPNHLDIGTPLDNSRDRDSKGRNRRIAGARKRDAEMVRLIQEKEPRGLMIGEFADQAGLDIQEARRRLRRLRELGLIEMRYEADDRRVAFIHPRSVAR
jgi:DNA-binding transcriptional ArsR family regulator